MTTIEKLVKELVPVGEPEKEKNYKLPEDLEEDYRYFMSVCNGGYSKDNFFHFFGCTGPIQHSVVDWNRDDTWKKWFEISDPWFFFAEDIWGDQFYFTRGKRKVIKTLWIHDGTSSLGAANFVDFIEDVVFGDTRDELKALAHQFFDTTGEQFQPFKHISYNVPLKLGGSETDVSNMELSDSLANLRFAGQVTTQLKTLSPGTRIIDVRIDPASGELKLIPEDPTT